jgi:hypothetical protein
VYLSDLASTLSGLTLNSQSGPNPRHNNQCVWLSGPEGRGKSKAALSTIHAIEGLRDKNARSSTSSTLIAYFFAAPTPDLSSAESVLKSILHQLISKRRSLALYAKDFAQGDRSRKKGVGGASEAMFTVPAMWKVLMNMLEDPAYTSFLKMPRAQDSSSRHWITMSLARGIHLARCMMRMRVAAGQCDGCSLPDAERISRRFLEGFPGSPRWI